MSLFRRAFLLACLALAVASSSTAQQGAASVPEPVTKAAADALILKAFRPQRSVGLSVAVVHNGQIVLQKGYGMSALAEKRAVTPETRFSIGSVTKQFTCACILLLAEEGRLSVHDRVSKYYRDLTRAADITLLDLMNHVSGYPDYYPLDFVDRRMQKRISPDGLLAIYARMPLDFEPGTRWSYSNTGFILLGRIVERVSRQSLSRFMQSRLFGPLGMTHTEYEPSRRGAEYAQGYTDFALSDPLPAAPEAMGWTGGAGAISSTPGDLAKWDIALIDGHVLKPESLKLMTTPRLLNDGTSTGYGCGLGIGRAKGSTVYAHGGATSGFLTQNVIIPATRSALIYCINCDDGEGGFAGPIVQALLPKTAPAEANPVNSARRAPAMPPMIAGASAEEAARAFFLAMQKGDVSAVPLGEEFRLYLKRVGLPQAAARLKALGELTRVTASPASERGGMAVCSVSFVVGNRTVGGAMYRSPDGRIQQLLIR